MKILLICILILTSTSCVWGAQEEVIKYGGGEPWAWYKTNWQGAVDAQAQDMRLPYPVRPVWILGDKEGEYLVYAHRKIICPYCDFVRTICFSWPFDKEYKCENCGKIYDENIGLYKWQKSIKRRKG